MINTRLKRLRGGLHNLEKACPSEAAKATESFDKRVDRLSRKSPLFWMALTAVAGIIFIGARFLLAPRIAAQGFGVPLNGGTGVAFAYAKGVRDIFSGLVGLPFLFQGQRRAIAWIILIATIIPIADGFIMIQFSGVNLIFLAIHWGAALYLIVLAVFLFRRRPPVSRDHLP